MNSHEPAHEKSFADYLAILISPILIMALVGSLVFFCVEVAYRGDNGGLIRWTLFWFVTASVLVSRIAIQNSSNQGALYGILLGVATGAMMAIYVDWVFGSWILLAFAWWFASKITWDCTVLDEDQDSSGEGLLEAAGFDEKHRIETSLAKPAGKSPRLVEIEGSGRLDHIPMPARASTVIHRTSRGDVLQGLQSQTQPRKRPTQKPPELPHSPGMWVIYFSLAALPLFGLGQHFIPKAQLAQRNDAFGFVLVYVIAALGLLLCSSFLNLRRYLRRRGLTMPGTMAAGWVGRGVVLGAVMVGLAVLLPRPQATYSLTSLLDSLDKKKEPSAQSKPSSLPGVEKHSNHMKGGQDGPNSAENVGAGKESEVSGRSNRGEGQRNGGGEKSVPRGSPAIEPAPSLGLGGGMKYLVYAALALFAAWHIYRNRISLTTAFLEILRSWKEFLRKLLGGDSAPSTPVSHVLHSPVKTFEALDNPFRSGAANHRSIEELARCTFEAMESWSQGSQIRREPNQTPGEFLRALGNQWPEMADSTASFASIYGRVAYGGQMSDGSVQEAQGVMEQLWRHLEAHRAG